MEKEFIRIKGPHVKLGLRSFSWDDHGHQIIYIPALDLSAYGDTIKEAEEMMEYSIEEFCTSLMSLSTSKRNAYLLQMGWHAEKFHKKNFSRTYIDKKGVLQQFDISDEDLVNVRENMIDMAL